MAQSWPVSIMKTRAINFVGTYEYESEANQIKIAGSKNPSKGSRDNAKQ